MNQSVAYGELMELAQRLMLQGQVKVLTGDQFVDVPEDAAAVTEAVFKLPGLKFTVRIVSDIAQPAFEWRAELTFDRGGPDFRHFLLRCDGEIVETFGREMVPLSDDQTAELISQIEQIYKDVKK